MDVSLSKMVGGSIFINSGGWSWGDSIVFLCTPMNIETAPGRMTAIERDLDRMVAIPTF
jgi:hypothetical protein